MSVSVFNEVSRFPNLVLGLFVFQAVIFTVFFLENQNEPAWMYFLISTMALGLFLILIRLKVTINAEKIQIRMIPFLKKEILFSEIKKAEFIRTSALKSFLGWGLRYHKKYGWAYITNTDYVFFIQKNNGKKLTFSIRNKERFLSFLEKIQLKTTFRNENRIVKISH